MIEGYPERIADIAADPERKLTDVPGIGKGIAGIVCDILEARQLRQARSTAGQIPADRAGTTEDSGAGAKEHRAVDRAFRSSMDDLERICKEQKLRTLPRMGAKLEEKVLRSIQQYRSSSGRFLLPFAKRWRMN